MPDSTTGPFTLRLVIGDPAHSEKTDDADRDIYGPIWDWISSFDLGHWPGSEDDDPGRYTAWDIRWDGEHAQLMMIDGDTGEDFWWTPPTPPPAQLMKYARQEAGYA